MKFWKFEYPGPELLEQCIKFNQLPPADLKFSGLTHTLKPRANDMKLGDGVVMATLEHNQGKIFAIGKVRVPKRGDVSPIVHWAVLTKTVWPDERGGLINWQTKSAFEIKPGPAKRYGLKDEIERHIRDEAFIDAASGVSPGYSASLEETEVPALVIPKEEERSAAEIFQREAACALENLDYIESLDALDPIDDLAMDHPAYRGLDEIGRLMVQKARIGQGVFRNKLIKYWGACSVTACEEIELLVASHIKPWRDCDYFEAMDVTNGFLLVPGLDLAFDRGFISFGDDGRIMLLRCPTFSAFQPAVLMLPFLADPVARSSSAGTWSATAYS